MEKTPDNTFVSPEALSLHHVEPVKCSYKTSMCAATQTENGQLDFSIHIYCTTDSVSAVRLNSHDASKDEVD